MKRRIITYSLTVVVSLSTFVWYSIPAVSLERTQTVLLVVIDTGADLDDKDLQGSFWKNEGEKQYNGIDDDGNGYIDDYIGFNAVDNRGSGRELNPSHGSTVCAITAGLELVDKQNISDETQSLIKIVPIKAVPEGSKVGNSWAMVRAFAYAIKLKEATKLPMVINLSMVLDDDSTTAVRDQIDVARSHGILVVAAVGNDEGKPPRYPAAYDLDNMLSVGGTIGDTFASYSNLSGDIAAEGSVIWKGVGWGTSFAAPRVSRTAAALFATHAGWNYLKVKQQVLDTADVVPQLESKVKQKRKLNDTKALAQK